MQEITESSICAKEKERDVEEEKRTEEGRREEPKDEAPHKRRIHYSGNHPKRYEEKYKELNPEKYPETVAKVISKGSTPAGMHIPIAVKEVLDVLKIQPGESGLDCTLGYGGHTRKFMETLSGTGHLTALDVDEENLARTEEMLRNEGYSKERLSILHLNFRDIDKAAEAYGPFDFVFADLGVSSMQLDDPKRGFSFKREGPLDLRLDASRGETAAERLKKLDREELSGLLMENADEPYADEIAGKVMSALRKKQPVETTTQLSDLVRQAVTEAMQKEGYKKADIEEMAKKSCARTFQALRIDVNAEYESLAMLLEKLPYVLKEGGRAAILSFHSGEDRLVKKQFKEAKKEGLYREISDGVIRASMEEQRMNPRSKPAKLRWAIK